MNNKSKITKGKYCWSDEDGNVSNFFFFRTEDSALKALQSLENCKDCTDCSNCSNCEGCIGGSDVHGCLF